MTNDKFLSIILAKYNECLNMTDHGCDIEWKHDECRVLREILLEATGEDRYLGYDNRI